MYNIVAVDTEQETADHVFFWASYNRIHSVYADFWSADCYNYAEIGRNVDCTYPVGLVQNGDYYTTIASRNDIVSVKLKWELLYNLPQTTQNTEDEISVIDIGDEGVLISGEAASINYFYFVSSC